MNGEVGARRLDVAGLRVGFSDWTDDTVADNVLEAKVHEVDSAQGEMERQRHQPLEPLRGGSMNRSELRDGDALSAFVRHRIDEEVVDGIGEMRRVRACGFRVLEEPKQPRTVTEPSDIFPTRARVHS